MKKDFILKVVVGIISIAIIIYSFSGGQTTTEYIESINKEREEKDDFMLTSSESPFKETKSSFTGLKYYPPDIRYKITARFSPFEKPQIITLATNDNQKMEYLEYGMATFTFADKEQKLIILENVAEEKLFLAFGDETSALETYGAGRYLDIKHDGGNAIVLDFNRAYNPYCAYSDNYSCPLPPIQNLLSVGIEAGEKTYHDDH